ncbi:serine hydrolase [Flammeovirga sp. OC4]|uniref:serine hydrolase domain-containing protein n=1 Tax=Flammeovirga sp. OC4 TaxID=1382345 RepID=UPI0006937A87|nr:serine hydrolase domain-containing protein [Flammeovirga sp. OC4]
MRTLNSLFLLLFCFCITLGCQKQPEVKEEIVEDNTSVDIDSLSQEELDHFQHIFDSTFTKLQKTRRFNGVVLGAKNKQIVYKKAFGYRDVRRRTKLEEDDIFQLASVSKQFTASAILMLEQDSLLSVNDSINKFFPDFPYPGITIKMLLDHRSGLPNYIYLMDRKLKDKHTPIGNQLCIDYMYEHKPGKYGSPDGRFKYSNSGYMLLASIVEKVSGYPFPTFLKERIFTPLQMDSTFTFDPVKVQQDNIPFGHTGRGRKFEEYMLDGVLGDKSVYSNVEDLFKWHKALLGDSILSVESKEKAFTFHSPKRKSKYNYGFGWRLFKPSDGTKVVYHGGWWRGYSTLFVHYPESEAFLIILTNRVNHSYVNTNHVFDALEIPEFRRR